MKTNLLSFLCAATVVAYLQRSALGVPSKAIERELVLTSGDMGLVWLAWYIGYAVFQLPSGALAERFGSKPALVGFAVVWSALTGLTGCATGFTGLLALWCAMGVAQAGIFVCATKALAATFPQSQQAFASGALACSMAGGAALSQWLTGELFGPLTWPQVLFAYTVPGFAWALAFALVVPNPERGVPTANPTARAAQPTTDWRKLFTNPQMVLLCVQQFARAAATALFFTWFPRYLQETKGVSAAESGALSAIPLIVGMFGGLLGGAISDAILFRTRNARLARQGTSFVAMGVCTGVSAGAYFAGTASAVVALVSAAAFCAYAAGGNAYALAMRMGGARVAPVFATMNMAGNVGAGVFPFALGKIADTTGNWNLAMVLFAGLFACSAVCWLLLNPKGTVFEEPT
jgi:nitrate/nitrite transporter NarK